MCCLKLWPYANSNRQMLVIPWELTDCGNSCASRCLVPDCGKEAELMNSALPSHNPPAGKLNDLQETRDELCR